MSREKKSLDILSNIRYNLSVERRKTLSIFKIKMKSTNKQESYEAALKEARLANDNGFGEILDMGERSKDELRKIYEDYLTSDGITKLVSKEIETEKEINSFFEDNSESQTEENVRGRIMIEAEKILKRIENAPDEHIYDFQYVC